MPCSHENANHYADGALGPCAWCGEPIGIRPAWVCGECWDSWHELCFEHQRTQDAIDADNEGNG